MKTPPPWTPRTASGRPTGHGRRTLTRHSVASLALALATAIAVPALGAAPATTAPILQGTPAAAQSARRDSPADAPRQSARSRAALAAPGQTSLKFDDKARRATLTVDDGYDLDQYLFADSSPIDFEIDLQGLDPTPVGGQPARLHLQVYDVDQAGSEDCGPEVDKVSVNGRNVGQLTGANNSWSINTFVLPPGSLTSKRNAFQVAIDTSGTGCWAVKVNYAQVELPFNIAQTAADATDDVTIRRGTTNEVIPDRIWASEFDSTGALTAPNPDDPIADAMTDSDWFGSGTTGSFTYKYTIGAWPKKPEWEPTVTATWQFSGPGGGLAQTEEPKTGWAGQLKILVPQQTGKYRLTVKLKIAKEGTLLRPEERQHDVYVLLGEPQSMGTRDRMKAGSVPTNTETPKTAWLDQAFQWGAEGQSSAHPILKALTNSIYGNPRKWQYVAKDWSTSVQLLEGTGNKGECNTFAGVWQILALSLGIDAKTGDYPGFFGVALETVFLTSNQRALDQNVSANVDRKGGAERERWAFQKHSWGVYNGTRYDPTFGVIEPNTDAALEVSTIFCDREGFRNEDRSWFCRLLAAPASRFLVRPKPGRPTNDAGWELWVYEPAATQLRPAPGRARTVLPQATSVPSDNGIDADGNGQFEELRLDLPVAVATAGTYTVLATLSTSSGSYVADGRLNAVERSTREVQITLPPGTATLPVYFSGRAIRVAGVDGPYVADVRVVGEDGTVIGTTRHTTRPYGHLSFQGLLASVDAITDSSVNTDGIPGDDLLRVNVPLTASGTGPVEVRAQLFSGDTRLGTVDRDINLTSSQTLALDFATSPLWAAGIDGPYTIFISVDDAFYGAQYRYTTAAYHADAFQPPAGYVLPGVTDQGQDSDGNGRYDTLNVTASVAATTASSYTLDGTLVASSGAIIASTSLIVTASATPTNLALRFNGREIARLGADGPYDLALSLTDAVGVRQMARTHRTKGYRAAEFEQPPASLRGPYADAAADTNGDGHPDVLRVEAGINVEQAGTYSLSGSLLDPTGSFVAQATTTTEFLTAGPGTARLDFEGADIQAHGVDGPYRLSGMELSLTDSGIVDTALDVHKTAAYKARQFRPRGPFFVERIEDQGNDIDGNGLFDELVVNVTVAVQVAGSYSANARLVDACGQEIEWSSTSSILDAGEHVLAIPFDGRRIAGHGVDGPYRVENLSVYDDADPENGITLADAHQTGAYTRLQFEPAGIVVGHVTAHGSPLAEAVVAVGGIAYDSTDPSGSYRLAIPQSGGFIISITADPALAPWQILVDGVPQSPGTSGPVQVTVGATTTVDWASP